MVLKIIADSLDDIDLKIMELLSDDGRLTDTDLAKQVGLSKTSVRLRKLKLIESGKIKILGIPILRKLGLVDADVMVTFKRNTSQNKIEEFVERVVQEDYVYEVNRYLYKYDLAIAIFHKDYAVMKMYLQDLFEKYDQVEKYEIFPIVNTDKAFGTRLEK